MERRILGKLTTRGRTTLPKQVREALDLTPGDTLVYRVQGQTVAIARAVPDAELTFATFVEWADEADALAYANL